MPVVTTTTRRLLLLRHAKADRPVGVADHVRPLAPRGHRDAAAVGRWLAARHLVPDLVLCSDATRAVESWDGVREGLGREVPVRHEPGLYDTSPHAVVQRCAELPDDVRTLLVVAHEPTMSAVAVALAGPGSDAGLVARVRAHLPTSGVVVLELDGAWQELAAGACRLVEVAAPRG